MTLFNINPHNFSLRYPYIIHLKDIEITQTYWVEVVVLT